MSDGWRSRLAWCALSFGCAIPSMVLGLMIGNAAAVLGVVALCCGTYAWITGTQWFDRVWQRPFVRTSIKACFIARIAMVIGFPFGWFVDLAIGAAITETFLGSRASPSNWTFLVSAAVALAQAAAIHTLLLVFGLGVYVLQRLFRTPQPRDGFCAKCGYDLRASPVRCPECGEPVRNDPLIRRLELEQ